MEEKWKRLIYNGEDYGDYYLVSNLGKIKNVKTDYILKNYTDEKNPYYKVKLHIDYIDKIVTIKVHRAVAQAFIPNPNNLPQVNHKDGNKLNNNVDNLEWVSAKQNTIHAVINNLYKSGENSELSKLKEEEIKYIKENCIPNDKNFGCAALGRKFNVHPTTISKIIHNCSWKEYSDDYELISYDIIGVGNEKIIYKYKCEMCNNDFEPTYVEQIYCSKECANKAHRKVERPNKEELFRLIKNTSFIEIGRMYGVSDNAVRKWCKSYELPYKRNDIKNL